MKKILSLLGTITLIGTSTTILVACNNKPKIHEYTKEQLTKLKEENNINTKDGILEWIAPQEKPFKKVENKWYFVVWRGNKNNNWRGIKFQINSSTINPFVIDNDGDRNLQIADLLGDLVIVIGIKQYVANWFKDDGTYFKAVYRLNNNREPNKDIENKLKIHLNLKN